MLKKSSLIGFSLMVGAMALATLAAVNPQASSPSTDGTGSNFRLAHTWNGFFIPSMDLTGVLLDPVSVNLPAAPAVANQVIPVTGDTTPTATPKPDHRLEALVLFGDLPGPGR
jgi:hypothetical protein